MAPRPFTSTARTTLYAFADTVWETLSKRDFWTAWNDPHYTQTDNETCCQAADPGEVCVKDDVYAHALGMPVDDLDSTRHGVNGWSGGPDVLLIDRHTAETLGLIEPLPPAKHGTLGQYGPSFEWLTKEYGLTPTNARKIINTYRAVEAVAA